MRIMESGNFTRKVRAGLYVMGLLVGYSGFYCKGVYPVIGMFLIFIGIILAALGGYSSWAHSLNIRPFGESEWRKAKRTYENDASN